MVANILHFGQEVLPCFPYLRKAGYFIHRYEKVLDFCEAAESGPGYDALSLAEVEQDVSKVVIHAARVYSRAPLILFRTRDGFHAESDFDLVIPSTAPPLAWISEMDELIARSREIQDESRRLRAASALLRQESSPATEKSRLERAGAEMQLNVSASRSSGLAEKVLICRDCGAEFVFTVAEQLFFQLRNFVNDPKQCKSCRFSLRNGRPPSSRLEATVNCARCGAATTVFFTPTRGRPVLCRACLQKNRNIA